MSGRGVVERLRAGEVLLMDGGTGSEIQTLSTFGVGAGPLRYDGRPEARVVVVGPP